jgi:cytochrome c5
MKRFGLIMVALSLGLVLIQCGGGKEEKASSETATPAKIEPVSDVQAAVASGELTYDLANGEAVYKKYCFACHDNGLAGAAKHSDTARWAESAAKGIPTLIKHATEGYQGKYGMLPPKGTCMECSDQDLTDAVHYQLKMGGVLK